MVYIAPGSHSSKTWHQEAPLGLGEEDPEENRVVRRVEAATNMDRPGYAQAASLVWIHMCSIWVGPATHPPESGSLCSKKPGVWLAGVPSSQWLLLSPLRRVSLPLSPGKPLQCQLRGKDIAGTMHLIKNPC